VEVVTGPEFVTGSTRMKAGTATKMILNMITTSVMIRLGHVVGNKMVDMQLSNDKLIERGTRMVMQSVGLSETEAREMLLKYGSVRKAIEAATA
jgi:N-acetylmuramic acid 6-phosphate etherase